MSNWKFLLLAAIAAAAVGCGGSGGGGSNGGGGGGGGGGTGGSTATVLLPNTDPGHLHFVYFPGPAVDTTQPVDPSDLTAFVVDTDISLLDLNNNPVAPALGSISVQLDLLNGLLDPTGFDLGHYTAPYIGTVDVPFSSGDDSRVFPAFPLSLSLGWNSISPVPAFPSPLTLDANFLVEPSRHTVLQLFLDFQMVSLDASNQPVVDTGLIQSANIEPITGKVPGFFSDFVMFDISNMSPALKPMLSNGSIGNRVFVSGDNFALSEGGATGVFEILTPTGLFDGAFNTTSSIFSLLQTITTTPGVLTAKVPLPTNLDNIGKMTAIQGTFRNWTDVIGTPSSFEAIVFPNSVRGFQSDMVMVQRDTGTGNITNLFFGGVDYQAMAWEAFPIADVAIGDSTNMISGDITGLFDGSGTDVGTVDSSDVEEAIRTGTYTLTGSAPTGFSVPSAGKFIVFRAQTVGRAIKSRAHSAARAVKKPFVKVPVKAWLRPSRKMSK